LDVFKDLYSYLPQEVSACLKAKGFPDATDLRFCLNKPVLVSENGKTVVLKNLHGDMIISSKDMISYISDRLTGGSMYSVGDNIAEGFVTVKGGYRVGICGTAVTDAGRICHIKNISALCFRVAREIRDCGILIADELSDGKKIYNMLIASPPGCGKTTLLRDLCRIMACGDLKEGIKRVGIADERGEIAGVCNGEATFDVGVGSFVCDGYPKAAAMNIMLRAMSPDVIATDEIGTPEDFEAVKCALKCGVSVIATAHAGDLADLKKRFSHELGCFDKIVFLKEKGKIAKIYRRAENDY